MSFWGGFSSEIEKVAVESLNLEKVETSGEHAAALDTNDEKGAKAKAAKLKDKVASMMMAKAQKGDGGVEKKAGVIGRKIRGKLYGEHTELALEPHAYTSKSGKKRYALLKPRKYDKKGNKIKETEKKAKK